MTNHETANHQGAKTPEDLTRLFVERANAGDAAGIAALYEDDAVMAYPPGATTVGRSAIRELWEKVLAAAPHFEAEAPLPTLVSGDLALTSTIAKDGAGARVKSYVDKATAPGCAFSINPSSSRPPGEPARKDPRARQSSDAEMTGRRPRSPLEQLGELAATLPEAAEEFPWGVRVAKVSGKIFVFLGSAGEEKKVMSVKLPISCDETLSFGCARPTRYGLGKSHWVTIGLGEPDCPPMELLADWIEESYRSVAPKRLVAKLDRDRSQNSGATTRPIRSTPPQTHGNGQSPRAKKSDRVDQQANLPT